MEILEDVSGPKNTECIGGIIVGVICETVVYLFHASQLGAYLVSSDHARLYNRIFSPKPKGKTGLPIAAVILEVVSIITFGDDFNLSI